MARCPARFAPDGSLTNVISEFAKACTACRRRKPLQKGTLAAGGFRLGLPFAYEWSVFGAAGGFRLGLPFAYQWPVFGIEVQGSAGGFGSPFCSNSIDCRSGERTKAIWPSRGGRLMVMPIFISLSQVE